MCQDGQQHTVCMQVDVVSKRNHILAVPMLSLALHWSAKLKGNPLAFPLTSLLAECRLRLHTHFAQFIMDRVPTLHGLMSSCALSCLSCSQCMQCVVNVRSVWCCAMARNKCLRPTADT